MRAEGFECLPIILITASARGFAFNINFRWIDLKMPEIREIFFDLFKILRKVTMEPTEILITVMSS